MVRTDVPTFPDFGQNRRFWVTSAKLPAWSGYQIRGGPYGSVSAGGRSDGTIQLVFAPEGRDDAPLKDHEIELVRWVVENQTPPNPLECKRARCLTLRPFCSARAQGDDSEWN
jgi:hypothetical protein